MEGGRSESFERHSFIHNVFTIIQMPKNGEEFMYVFLNGLFDILILIIAMLKLFVCMYS